MEAYRKLPQEFKDQWVVALRSGKYKQCFSGDMYKNGAYCCLGVAAELSGYRFDDKSEKRSAYCDVLPTAINNGFMNGAASKLMSMNDDQRMTFDQISNWIEKNL